MSVPSIRRGMTVGFFGIGRSNLSLLRCLGLRGVRVNLRSDGPIDRTSLPSDVYVTRIYEGAEAFSELCEDVMFFSPSVRREREELARLRERGCIFSSDVEMFFGKCEKDVFCVTGSDGKSTTASIARELLSKSCPTAALVGNIGTPMYESLEGHGAYVAELSSFMLQYFTPKVRRACVTNITPNHLDWHKDHREYAEAKLALVKCACEGVYFVDSRECAEAISGEIFSCVSFETPFSDLKKKYNAALYLTCEDGCIKRNGEELLSDGDISLIGTHNRKNFALAIALTDGFCDKAEIREVAREFKGLKHRCEKFLTVDGCDFYDSSIDTTPSRTAATLASLGKRVIIILGGRGKGVGFRELRSPLLEYASVAILYGECAEEIEKDVMGACEILRARNFDEAAKVAYERRKDGLSVLLSPAATSYDTFKCYEERGERFKKIINSLYTNGQICK